ncbi:MAG TPA: hypothetical protein VMD09_10950 [Solirubrobacteraceae bacterium]|nr:hypothetical protein [Solirubrobacteraceae bacterium]
MESGWWQRWRWRHRGAWLWPVFVAAIVADAVLEHARPPAGDRESLVSAALVGLVLNLLAVLLCSRPVGGLLRRAKPDLPRVVARNYAGTTAVLAVSVALLLAGVVHHGTVLANQSAMRDATVRAEAWIGAHAKPEFLRNVALADTFAIEPGSIYRTCVPGQDDRRTFCVIVNTNLPFSRSVKPDGYTPNSVFASGVG